MFNTKRSLTLAGAGLVTVLALGACGSDADDSQSMGGMNGHGSSSATSAQSSSGGRAGDVMFAQMMIPHHQQAVEMADLALANPSTSPEVEGLAQQIKAAQDPEIETMNGWLSAWGAPTSAPMDHGASGMMSEKDMASLESAQGAEFNRLWLEMMIEHHQGAITMAEDVLASTEDPEVKALAQAVVEGQEKEITTMQGLLR
ncbi:DUF305 domain-containing protein [Knoellia sp. 3-2P3]|uniref:DUF305 domain-containing protein n=1 Tax=unclassified Knoellia TaxID=2618719 RepID=UPI0023DC176A|nr:DUF305 domain-containing protein [Knoellia sp. 3-2P3]MDF2093660.1 DUF305 domain-containing protein [Knoellia sp. 3-2P3]